MRLTLINTSPKGKNGNTEIVSQRFIDGFLTSEENIARILHLTDMCAETINETVKLSDYIIIAFPLYVFNLPAATINVLRLLDLVKADKKMKIGFICQFGFLEACHARAIEHLLHRYCDDIGAENIGVIIRGGCEGIKRKYDSKKPIPVLENFYEMGRYLTENKKFSTEILDWFSKPERIGNGFVKRLRARLFIFKANRFMWGALLKKNNALEKHWDQPLLRNLTDKQQTI
jgi:hypothetical protein